MTRPRLLVVGNGMTTDRFLDELAVRGGLDAFGVTVVGEEPTGAYNRVLLSKVLAGADPDTVVTKPLEWYSDAGVELIAGRWVQRLDVGARRAQIGNGEALGYDVAVFATGSEALLPPVNGVTMSDGSRTGGVHVYRSMEDCLRLRAEIGPGQAARDVVVVGGGLLGLEAAKAVLDWGHRVTIVHPVEHLLSTQLDETGGELLRAAIEDLGIDVVTGMAETVLCGRGLDGHDQSEALLLADGTIVAADTVVFTVGVRPRIESAVASGIEVERGIVVDDRFATSAPDVYAMGECAQHGGTTVGLVAPCWDHAAVLAEILAGDNPAARYTPAPDYARLKVAGVEVTSIGELHAVPGDEVVEILERSRGVYRRMVVRDGLLAGAIVVGDSTSGPALIRLIERGDPLPPNRLDIFCTPDAFRSDGAGEGTLCSCNRVSRDVIEGAIGAGARTAAEVGQATRAGTGCGSCVAAIERLLAADELTNQVAA